MAPKRRRGGGGLAEVPCVNGVTTDRLQRSLCYGLDFLGELVHDDSVHKVVVQSVLHYAVKHGLALDKGNGLYELVADADGVAVAGPSGAHADNESEASSTVSRAPSLPDIVAANELPSTSGIAAVRTAATSSSGASLSSRKRRGSRFTSSSSSSVSLSSSVSRPRTRSLAAQSSRERLSTTRSRSSGPRTRAAGHGDPIGSVKGISKGKAGKAGRKPGVSKGTSRKGLTGDKSKGKGKGKGKGAKAQGLGG